MKYLIFNNIQINYKAIYEYTSGYYQPIYRSHQFLNDKIFIEEAKTWTNKYPHLYTFTDNIDKELAKVL